MRLANAAAQITSWYAGMIIENRHVSDGAITNGQATLTSSSASFIAGDAGRQVTVFGAGAASANLVTTIWSIANGATAVLAASASTTVSGALVSIGPLLAATDTMSSHPGWTEVAAFGTAVTAGNALIAMIALGSASASVTSVSDSNGNIWTKTASAQAQSRDAEIWFALNATAGGTTVSVNCSTSVAAALTLIEASWIFTNAALDRIANISGSSKSQSTGWTLGSIAGWDGVIATFKAAAGVAATTSADNVATGLSASAIVAMINGGNASHKSVESSGYSMECRAANTSAINTIRPAQSTSDHPPRRSRERADYRTDNGKTQNWSLLIYLHHSDGGSIGYMERPARRAGRQW